MKGCLFSKFYYFLLVLLQINIIYIDLATANNKSVIDKPAQALRFNAGDLQASGTPIFQLNIVAVGDILLHKPLHVQALQKKEGHKSLWSNVLDVLKGADMTYGNLEGPVAKGITISGKSVKDPGDEFDNFVYTSFPRFNYHEELISDLVESGFDVVSTANNHALDRGSIGVDKTIEALQSAQLQFTGTRTRNDSLSEIEDWATIIVRNGFRIAWLACTFSTNGLADPYHQVLDCYRDTKSIQNIINKLSMAAKIDAVIVTPHTGIEYMDAPEKRAISLYRSFIDSGALAVFGAHPHVLQPWERYLTKEGKEGFIIYSLGNFVSGQFQKVKTRASILLSLKLKKTQLSKAQIAEVNYIPLEMVRSSGNYQVLTIDQDSGTKAIFEHIVRMFGFENKL